MKSKRPMVKIDENKCNGCGLCIPNCAEGAIQIIDGKARLVADNLCDGLGACLGHCPMNAITVEEREADAFDEAAVHARLTGHAEPPEASALPASHHAMGGCPGSRMLHFNRSAEVASGPTSSMQEAHSELTQWPVQLALVPAGAPYFRNADLLVAADCVAYAYANFHQKLLRGKALVIACPKLDDGEAYVEKMADIIRQNDLKSITVAHMEVPCCSGLSRIVKIARTMA
ncbi:MAG: ATP-binding protein, partial [Bacillota bacterium]